MRLVLSPAVLNSTVLHTKFCTCVQDASRNYGSPPALLVSVVWGLYLLLPSLKATLST